MSNARKALIQQAFNKMDSDKSGVITVCTLYFREISIYCTVYCT